GDPARLRDAIWSFNHASWYVDLVLADAAGYGQSPPAAAPAADVGALLNNPRLVLTARARSDLASGAVDPRLTALLGALTNSHTVAVSVFKTGHTEYVAGTDRVSNHFSGRAA